MSILHLVHSKKIKCEKDGNKNIYNKKKKHYYIDEVFKKRNYNISERGRVLDTYYILGSIYISLYIGIKK